MQTWNEKANSIQNAYIRQSIFKLISFSFFDSTYTHTQLLDIVMTGFALLGVTVVQTISDCMQDLESPSVGKVVSFDTTGVSLYLKSEPFPHLTQPNQDSALLRRVPTKSFSHPRV